MTPVCCMPGCDAAARFELCDGNGIDEYTHACVAHVGLLARDDRATALVPLPAKQADEVKP